MIRKFVNMSLVSFTQKRLNTKGAYFILLTNLGRYSGYSCLLKSKYLNLRILVSNRIKTTYFRYDKYLAMFTTELL